MYRFFFTFCLFVKINTFQIQSNYILRVSCHHRTFCAFLCLFAIWDGEYQNAEKVKEELLVLSPWC